MDIFIGSMLTGLIYLTIGDPIFEQQWLAERLSFPGYAFSGLCSRLHFDTLIRPAAGRAMKSGLIRIGPFVI